MFSLKQPKPTFKSYLLPLPQVTAFRRSQRPARLFFPSLPWPGPRCRRRGRPPGATAAGPARGGARGSARSFSPAPLEVAGLAGWEGSQHLRVCPSGGSRGAPRNPRSPRDTKAAEERSPLVCEVARKPKASVCWRQAEASAGERSFYRSEVLCRLKPASVRLFWKVMGNASGVGARCPVRHPRYPLSRCGILGGESSWGLSVMQIIKVSL